MSKVNRSVLLAAALAGACAAPDGAPPDDPVDEARGALAGGAPPGCAFLNDKLVGSVLEWARAAGSGSAAKLKVLDTMCEAIDEFVACDGPLSQCAAQGLLSGACEHLGSDAVEMTHPLAVFSRYYSEVVSRDAARPQYPCLPDPLEPPAGMSSLHCCRFTEDQPYCHSGFAAPSINCTIDYGNASLNHLGLPTCENIPECAAPLPQDPETPADVPPPTVEMTLRTLENKYLDRVRAAGAGPAPIIPAHEPDGGEESACKAVPLFDLGTFRGCSRWETMIGEARPLSGEPQDWVSAPEAAAGYTRSAVTMQILANFAATRIAFGIPNGLERIEAANLAMDRNYWRTADAYIAELEADLGVDLDPEAELRRWLSPCAIELLKSVLYDWWQLLAYPTPNEVETTLDPDLYEDACVAGKRPRLLAVALRRTGDRWMRELTVEAHDPDLPAAPVVRLPSSGRPSGPPVRPPVSTLVYETVAGGHIVAPFVWHDGADTATNIYSYPWDDVARSPVLDIAIMNSSGLISGQTE